MAGMLRLLDLPNDFSVRYLPYSPTLRQKQRATAFVQGCYVKSVTLSSNDSPSSVQILSKVYRSQRKSEAPHTTSIDVDTARKTVSDACCSCKAGMGGKCAHVLAVINIIEQWKVAGYKDFPDQPASTSLPQQWDKPRGVKICSEPVSQMVIANPGTISRKRRPVMVSFNDNRKIQVSSSDVIYLKSLQNSPISYLVEDPSSAGTINTPVGPQPIGSPLGYHAPMMTSSFEPRQQNTGQCGNIEYPQPVSVTIPDIVTMREVEWQHVSVTQAKALETEIATRKDRKRWLAERKLRITASNFGHIMKRKKEFSSVFVKNIFDRAEFQSAPTSYGHANENIAKQMYIKQTGNHIHEIGLVINPAFPFLGATPDAVVCEKGNTGIVEIKCPYTVRDSKLSDAVTSRKDFFLEQSNNSLKLKRNHLHWFQVQGQLLVTGALFSDFVTYTKQDFNVERIYPEFQTMTDLLQRLTEFYFDHFKPNFLKRYKNQLPQTCMSSLYTYC